MLFRNETDASTKENLSHECLILHYIQMYCHSFIRFLNSSKRPQTVWGNGRILQDVVDHDDDDGEGHNIEEGC